MLNNTIKSIRKLTWIIIAVLIIMVGIIMIFQKYKTSPWESNRVNSVIGLLGAAICSAALPIFFRTLGFHISVKESGMSIKEFKRMKLLSLFSVFLGSLFVMYSCIIPIYRYHMYLAVLVGIYGIYSILPFERGYRQDINGFGVKDE